MARAWLLLAEKSEKSSKTTHETLAEVLPSDADIDRAIAFVGHFWQRFVDAIARAQKQVFNKS